MSVLKKKYYREIITRKKYICINCQKEINENVQAFRFPDGVVCFDCRDKYSEKIEKELKNKEVDMDVNLNDAVLEENNYITRIVKINRDDGFN